MVVGVSRLDGILVDTVDECLDPFLCIVFDDKNGIVDPCALYDAGKHAVTGFGCRREIIHFFLTGYGQYGQGYQDQVKIPQGGWVK